MSGSAKAGTTAERHKCELRMLASVVVRAPPKPASGELCSPLTKTYMDVGFPEVIQIGICGSVAISRLCYDRPKPCTPATWF
jgi:hypothetical protein